ncbi:hypothetical protein BDW59DRAFT_175797 [Aspergillus cavernicola]|uniref:DUF7703 domain-containing protein n=1 Tax=Aspergillus cavernicola TaxID=176166 RepID=A0ABR4HLS2_9EURO
MPSAIASDATGFPLTQDQKYAFTVFASITFYTCIEVIILCLSTFKRYRGLYFWCLLLTSCSVIVNTLGFLFFFFVPVSPYFSITVIILGWCVMVTGHSIVLWSRLHFVLQYPTLLRAILYIIIANAICMCIPTTVLLYGAVNPSPFAETRIKPGNPFAAGYNIMERIQLVVFCLQEVLISIIYIWETSKLLRLRPNNPSKDHRIILTQLLAINIIILVLDIIVVVFQYAGLFALQVGFKPMAYSIKLRLEYAILGRLVHLATGGVAVSMETSSAQDVGSSIVKSWHIN